MWRLFTVRIKFAFPNRSHYIIYSFTYTYFRVFCNTPQLAILCSSQWGCKHVHFCGSDYIEKVQCDQREADVNSDRARRVADLGGRWSDGKKTLGAPGSLVINTIVCHPSVWGSGLTSRLAILSVGHLFAGLGVGSCLRLLLFSSRSQSSMPFLVLWLCLRVCEVYVSFVRWLYIALFLPEHATVFCITV